MIKRNTEKLERFLLEEYSNIAQAHFKSIETISTFFRYYLLIMSIPISVVVVISRIGSDEKSISSLIQLSKLPISIVLFCISLIGLGVCCYVINLRLDVILYSRVVNGIRKFFYDSSDMDIDIQLRMRALPQSPQMPSYSEESYFLPVVCVFAIMNTLYFSFAFYIAVMDRNFYIIFALSIFIFLLLHLVIYSRYARHRETAYLRSNILGIDIDGVLNKHRDHFCKILQKNTGKKIKADDILIMPVHEDSNLNIERADERQVFNDPEYWKDMPDVEDASNVLRNFKNIFKLKLHIFTYRPWPDAEDIDELKEKVKLFSQQLRHISLKEMFLKLLLKISHVIPFSEKILNSIKEEPLKYITKEWLKEKRIVYDKFVFEKGNDYSSDPRGEFNNRFYIARKKKIRFFIEDDIEKALKLSFLCDVVFLLSHPYNEPNRKLSKNINKSRENIPSNVIRVKTWTEIYQHVRLLS